MKKLIACGLTALMLFSASAHEYVLIADDFVVQKGEPLALHLFVADGFNVEAERPVQRAMTRRYGLLSAQGATDLLATATEAALPVLTTTVDFEGQGLIHLERDYAYITMENEAFQRYLKNDHIEGIQIDEDRPEQSERYSRYLKALVQSTPQPNDTLYRTVVGQTCEIVLLDDPYRLALDDAFRARVTFRGQPLANKTVTARNRLGGEAATHQLSRTDADGVCRFQLDRAGDWFVHLTHMTPSTDPAEAIWESFWASYSFGHPEKE